MRRRFESLCHYQCTCRSYSLSLSTCTSTYTYNFEAALAVMYIYICMWCVLSHVLSQRADLEAGKKPDKVMGAQAHKRSVAALQRQIASQEKRLEEVSESAVVTRLRGEQCYGTCSYAGIYTEGESEAFTTVHVSLENLPLPSDTHQLFMYKVGVVLC